MVFFYVNQFVTGAKTHLVVRLNLSADGRLLSQHLCILWLHSQSPFTQSQKHFLTLNHTRFCIYFVLDRSHYRLAMRKEVLFIYSLWSHLWRTAENLPGQQWTVWEHWQPRLQPQYLGTWFSYTRTTFHRSWGKIWDDRGEEKIQKLKVHYDTPLGNKLAPFQRQYFTCIQSQTKKKRKILWLFFLKFKVNIIFFFWLHCRVNLRFYVKFCTAAFKPSS